MNGGDDVDPRPSLVLAIPHLVECNDDGNAAGGMTRKAG